MSANGKISLIEYLPNSVAGSSLIQFDKKDILVGARAYFHCVSLHRLNGLTRSICFVLKPKKPEYLEFCLALCDKDSAINCVDIT